jgi:hypothetical protein
MEHARVDQLLELRVNLAVRERRRDILPLLHVVASNLAAFGFGRYRGGVLIVLLGELAKLAQLLKVAPDLLASRCRI